MRPGVLVVAVVLITGCGEGTIQTERVSEPIEFRLDPIVRIGALAEGPPEYLFSLIRDLEVDPVAEEVYVSDRDAQYLRVFSREGEFVRRIGGQGDGPAEFDDAPAFGVARDTVLAVDQTGLHVFLADGRHVRTGRYQTLHPFPIPEAVAASSTGWRMLTLEFGPRPNSPVHQRLYRIDISKMQLSDPLAELELPASQGIYLDQPNLTMSGDGYVEAAGIEYRLVRHWHRASPDTFSFSHDPVVPSVSDFDDYEAAQRASCESIGADIAWCLESVSDDIETRKEFGLPAYRPVVGRIVGSSEGRLLVERTDLDPLPFEDTGDRRWDLISDGEVEGRVRTPGGLRVLWFGAGEIWGSETDEFGVPFVVGYRIIEP